MSNIEKQFHRIQHIEEQLYAAIHYKQQQLQRQFNQTKEKKECEKNRQTVIKEKNMKEQVTHPYNNGIWVYLAHCMDEDKTTDLDGIRERQKRRQEIRQKIESKKVKEEEKKEKKSKKEEKEQVPWKLMRKLREHDVAENKKRKEKVNNYQLKYTKAYHN